MKTIRAYCGIPESELDNMPDSEVIDLLALLYKVSWEDESTPSKRFKMECERAQAKTDKGNAESLRFLEQIRARKFD